MMPCVPDKLQQILSVGGGGLKKRFYTAFTATAALTCVVGILGWIHVESMGRNVDFVAQIVTPVLAENAILRDASTRLRALVSGAEAPGDVENFDTRVAEANRLTARSLDRMTKFLPSGPAAETALGDARSRYDAFVAALSAFRPLDARRAADVRALDAAGTALKEAMRGVQARNPAAWAALGRIRDTVERHASEGASGLDAVAEMQGILRGVRSPSDAETLRAAAIGTDGLYERRAALVGDLSALARMRRTIDEAGESYGDALDTVGDVTRELLWQTRRDQRGTVARARAIAMFSVIVAALLAALAGVFFTRRVVEPLVRITEAMRRLATGDLDAEVPDADGSDEMADLAAAMTVFKENARQRDALEARAAEDREALIKAEERRRIEEAVSVQNARFDTALSNMSQGLVMFDANHRLTVCNAAYASLFGLPDALRRTGIPLSDLLAHRVAHGSISEGADYASLVCDGTETRGTSEYRDGRHVAMRRTPLPGGGWVTTYEDVTEQRRWDERYRHMAAHDALTELPNRNTFRESLERLLANPFRETGVAVHCLDLDRFKEVNDTLGHPVGDALLREVAARLTTAASGCVVSRLGGDEFAIIQVVSDQSQPDALAARILDAMAVPFQIEGHRIPMGASVGHARGGDAASDADTLIRRADIALYAAKGLGRGRALAFHGSMEADVVERRALEADLRVALAEGGLAMHYQPLVSFETGRVTGAEALMRWTHPTRGPVSPAVFIPIAEGSGLICRLGEWALRRACEEALHWPAQVKVAVNLSPEQFRSGEDIVGIVRVTLAETGLPAERLGLEITESVLLDEDERTLASLHALRALGVTVSLDDFGTGFSSLGYLSRFPFDKIKIDQSFVRGMLGSVDCAAIVKAVITLAAEIEMTTVAEGVETREQYQRLRELGCGEAQGYLISKPRPSADVIALMDADETLRAAA